MGNIYSNNIYQSLKDILIRSILYLNFRSILSPTAPTHRGRKACTRILAFGTRARAFSFADWFRVCLSHTQHTVDSCRVDVNVYYRKRRDSHLL